MARAPIGGLMDTNVPSQLDKDDLSAELELEIPDSRETPLMLEGEEEIEIVTEDDGGVLVDFDPLEEKEDMGFSENLAEGMDDRELGAISSELMGEFDANKAGRQEWEDAYTDGLELLGFNYALAAAASFAFCIRSKAKSCPLAKAFLAFKNGETVL